MIFGDLIGPRRRAKHYRYLFSVLVVLILCVSSGRGIAGGPVVRLMPRKGPMVVVIDPGHGGSDPGTTGAHGLHEKKVTLEIARRVEDILSQHARIRVVLTRTRDRYVSLRQRVYSSRRHHADLFVSIHVNSSPVARVSGGAVYMLSAHGASSIEARAVAHAENGADPDLSGVPLAPRHKQLNSVLVNLAQAAAIRNSDELGADILHRLAKVEPLVERRVQRANFEVLRDLGVPSVLVETAFLSNPEQAHLLHGAAFRDNIASAIADGILAYCHVHPPMERVNVSRGPKQNVADDNR